MVLKTFNVSQDVYARFSQFCKGHGMSMSKQVEIFMASQVEDDPVARKEYINKLNQIRKMKSIKVDDFSARFNL